MLDDSPQALDILPRHTISAYIFNDGIYTRLAWSVLPNTRDVLGKHKRDYFVLFKELIIQC